MDIELLRQIDRLQAQVDGLVKPELPIEASIRPLFSAYNSATDVNVTGDNTLYTIIFNAEITNRNGDYNNANGILTAPVDGNYLLIAGALLADLGAFNAVQFLFNTSNRNYYTEYLDADQVQQGGYYLLKGSVIADMDAADTARVQVQVAGGGKTVDVYGAASAWTFFMGYMLI